MMKRDIGAYIDAALLASLALVPLIWFRDGYGAVAGFDFAVYLNPLDMLEKSMFVWSDRMAGGYDISHEVSSLPYYLMFAAPLYLGASFYGSQKFVFSMLFALQGFSMYFMLSSLFSGHNARRTVALSGAVIYAFSYPVMAHFGRGNMMALLTYGLMPILIGLLHRGFTEPENGRKTMALIALLSFPIAATKGHPADFVVLVAVSFMFVIFHLLASDRKKAGRILIFTFKALAVSVFASLWWLVPNLVYLSDFGLDKGDLLSEGFFNLDILTYYSRGTSILNVFRNERLDLWFDVPQDEFLNPALYQSGLFVAIGLFIPIASMMALLSKPVKKNSVFFALLGVVAVFMAKGSHEPFGRAFEWLYMNVPGFFFFRAPYRVFSSLVTFALTPLLALAAGELAMKISDVEASGAASPWLKRAYRRWALPQGALKDMSIRVFITFGLITVSLYAWPVFTGAHMKERGTVREPGVFHRIPGSYYEAGSWVSRHGEGSKVYYPYETYDANTDWGYNGPDPSFELIEAPKVVSRPGGTVYIRYQRPIESLNRLIWGWEYGDLKKLIGMHNIKYLLIHDDFNRWVMPFYNFNSYAESLLSASGVRLSKEHGPLKFYENPDYMPKVYGSARTYIFSGDESSLRDVSTTGYAERPFLVMAKNIDSVEDASALLDSADGLIAHNASLPDAVVELLSKSFRAEFGGKRLKLSRPAKAGVYGIYVSGGGAGNAAVISKMDSEPSQPHEGLRWKKAGSVFLRDGEGSLKMDWLFNSGKTKDAQVIVIPEETSTALGKKILERISEEGFETAFFFDVKALSAGLATFLAGDGLYEASALRPARFEREKKDAMEGSGQWMVERIEGEGDYVQNGGSLNIKGKTGLKLRATRQFALVDAAQYPQLVFGKDLESIKKMLELSVWMEFRDLNGSSEALELRDAAITEQNDIIEGLRRNHTTASFHRLKEMTFEITLKEDTPMDKRIELELPGLMGEFGVAEKPCGDSEKVISINERKFRAASDCGHWHELGQIEPGKTAIKAGPEADCLLALKKMAKDVKKPAHVEFAMINPAKYKITVSGEDTSNIVFSESFNKGWRLYANGKEYRPMKVNGYANGFVVDERGPFTGTIEYAPQRIYDYSKAASVLSVIGVVCASFYSRKKDKRDERR